MDIDSHRQRTEISILKCLRNKYSTLLELQDFCDNLYRETFAQGQPDQTLDLPNDIRALILDQLRFLDAKNLMCTSKAWSQFRFSQKGNEYWFRRFKKTFYCLPPSHKLEYTVRSGRDRGAVKKIPWFFVNLFALGQRREGFRTFLAKRGLEISDREPVASIKSVLCPSKTICKLEEPALKHLHQQAIKLLESKPASNQSLTIGNLSSLIVEAAKASQSSNTPMAQDFARALATWLDMTNQELMRFIRLQNVVDEKLYHKVCYTVVEYEVVKELWSIHHL